MLHIRSVYLYFQIDFDQLLRNDNMTSPEIDQRNNKESSAVELSLEKQMYSWKENPIWEDHPPDINVRRIYV